MSIARAIVTYYTVGQISRDYCTNTVHYDITNLPLITGGPDYGQLADEVLAAFLGGTDDPGFVSYKQRNVEVRIYDLADPKPRPEKAFRQHLNNFAQPNLPTELAVVLSYYCDRNIPGSRGRIFVGPFTGGNPGEVQQSRPSDVLRQSVLDLGNALWNVGGGNVKHVLYHEKATQSGHAAGSSQVVTTYDVADAWGVVHSRGFRATNRLSHTP